MSLGLAFFICFFMTGCIIWRRNKARLALRRDEEMKMRRRRGRDVQDDTDALVEKEDKVNRHMWARATARWKANARYLARQRRGHRRNLRPSSIHGASITLDPPPDEPPASPHVSSEAASRHPPSSLHETSTCPLISSTDPASPPSQHDDTPFPEASLPPHPAYISPPAYHPGTTRIPPPMRKHPEWMHGADSEMSHTNSQPPLPSNDAAFSEPPIPYSPLYTAHVAVDDKTLMARMAKLSSAPPISENASGSSNIRVSAPVWQDEELEDFAQNTSSSHNPWPPPHTPVSPFPPPPAPPPREKETSYALHYYKYSCEDLDIVESDMGPSAPPFEEGHPDVPLFDMTPSAPPMQEDTRQDDMTPCAPPLQEDTR
jgi:hypothetical protein